MKLNLPTSLTLLRILIIPIFVLVYMLYPSWGHPVAAFLFALAAITDWLDGYLARTMNLSTRFGEFLDPVADKLVVTSALVMIVGSYDNWYLTIAAIIIVGREIIISALREWMAELGRRRSVAVSFLGKIKTTCQMVALIMLLAVNLTTPFWIAYLGTVLLYIAAILTLWSMCVYIKLAWPDFKAES